jgi:hypothetical protein
MQQPTLSYSQFSRSIFTEADVIEFEVFAVSQHSRLFSPVAGYLVI